MDFLKQSGGKWEVTISHHPLHSAQSYRCSSKAKMVKGGQVTKFVKLQMIQQGVEAFWFPHEKR